MRTTSTPNRSDSAAFLDPLAAIVGSRHVLTTPDDMAPALTDWRGRYRGRALAVVRPGSTAEVQALVRACLAAGVPMVPQGGNTGLCGGATPDESGRALVIQLGRLNRIRSLDACNHTLVAEAGCCLAAVQAAAREAGLSFPLSLASEGSCQIGGNLSTNAGGVQVLRYGTTRDLVLGIEAVLPNGECWDGLMAVRKNNTGYDLRHLLIGAEGTLGIITAAVLKLFPEPRTRVTAWLGLASPAAATRLLERLQQRFDAHLTAFELICPRALALVRRHIGAVPPLPDAPWHVLCELGDSDVAGALQTRVEAFFPESLAAGDIAEALLARSEGQRQALWRIRENISEAQKREGVSIKHDIALPVSRVPEFLDRIGPRLQQAFAGIRYVAFGHLGDGNLHFNLSMPDAGANAALVARQTEANRIVHDLVHELGGSIAAEHGLGQLKRDEIRRYKSPVELAAMQAIKQALDPAGLMNPGKVL
ncbi:MAG: FAD-binding oxidoreductase [Azovibrio sp.]|nr:FAD-binding oxidoreductase [Azovibrio sp.]